MWTNVFLVDAPSEDEARAKAEVIRVVMRSLKASVITVVLFVIVRFMPSLGIWPAQPWDLAAFVLMSLGVPFAGLAATLVFVSRELPKPWGTAERAGSSPTQTAVAVLLAVGVVLAGGTLFLSLFRDH